MIARQLIRRYALNQKIDPEVADQEIALHYALGLLNETGLLGQLPDGSFGPLLFKGGTALRKCWFGSSGRFSQDIDLDAPHRNGFEAGVEAAFIDHNPFHGITFKFAKIRWSDNNTENFSGTVHYEHEHGTGRFELQISYRLQPVLQPRDLYIVDQEYHSRVKFARPVLFGLDPYEMIGEKILACNRRQGGSAKDVYDLYLWSGKPFNSQLVRRVAALKAWTDQRHAPRFDPENFLNTISPQNFRWEDLNGLVPRNQHDNRTNLCDQVRARFAFLTEVNDEEQQLLEDQTAHRYRNLYEQLLTDTQTLAANTIQP